MGREQKRIKLSAPQRNIITGTHKRLIHKKERKNGEAPQAEAKEGNLLHILGFYSRYVDA